jgi:moderate conductance mechanosensitive channel
MLWSEFFAAPVNWGAFFLAVTPTLLLAWFVARWTRLRVTALLQSMLGGALAPSSPLVRAPLRLLGLAMFLLLAGLLIFPALDLAGLEPRAGIPIDALEAWLLGDGLRIVLIALFAAAAVRITALIVQRFEHEVAQGSGLDALERAKRVRTLGAVISKVLTTLIAGVALLMILQKLGIDITPVLTGAGIVGLAVGFGAQTLVRDVITGFFLLLENQVRVGDVAAINGTSGLVEQINLRTIVLRDVEGIVHVFPNGSITTLSNRTKDFSYYVIELGVSYKEDPDHVIAVLREVGAELQRDPVYAPSFLEPVEIMGVDAFADSAVVIKLRIKTMPLKQWEVGREYRRRLKKTFDARGIEIPFPQRVVTMRSDPPSATV